MIKLTQRKYILNYQTKNFTTDILQDILYSQRRNSMVNSVQNYNYKQNYTGSIKMNPAMRAVEKHLQKTANNIEQFGSLEFYNFIRMIKNDKTNNKLIVTTSKRTFDIPANIRIETGSETKTKTIHKYTVTNVKYGDVVREYSEQIYDIPNFRLNLGRTIQNNLIKFGEELFGEKNLTKLTTENSRQYARSTKKNI